MGLRIKIKIWASDLARNQDLLWRKEGLEPQSKNFSIPSNLGNVASKLVQLKHVTEFPATGRFFGKKWLFNAIRITFRTFSEPFERTKFFVFESQLKKFLSSGQIQNTFKILHFGVKFCDLAQVRGNQGTLLCATFLPLNNAHEDLPLKIFVLS